MNWDASIRGAERGEINREAAVALCLGRFADEFPHLRSRYQPEDPRQFANVVSSWADTVGEYGPRVILLACRRMLRQLAEETRDIAPTSSRLIRYCREVAQESRSRMAEDMAMHRAEAAALPEGRSAPTTLRRGWAWIMTLPHERRAQFRELLAQGVTAQEAEEIVAGEMGAQVDGTDAPGSA